MPRRLSGRGRGGREGGYGREGEGNPRPPAAGPLASGGPHLGVDLDDAQRRGDVILHGCRGGECGKV